MHLPVHYGEIVNTDVMARDVTPTAMVSMVLTRECQTPLGGNGWYQSSNFGRYMYDNFSGHSNSNTLSISNNFTAETTTTMATTSPSPAKLATDTLQSDGSKTCPPTPLIEAQNSLLARDPDFTIVPRYSPKGEYITAVKQVCLKLSPKAVTELRTETGCLLKRGCPLDPTSPRKRLGLSQSSGKTGPGSFLQWTRG